LTISLESPLSVGAMTRRTGKSGKYRYDTCCTKARQGETGCAGRTVPAEKRDTLVADHIEKRLLQEAELWSPV
jgi:site-specific DNA recombinase